ncbi:O-antigen ligase [Cohnella sp. AR92]|uniref:O-antigen ligase family protein n=1 Tax=Cohnella sp. AR92 TaxID=648716 RepID=UPI000F8D053A|nr:hypothetical protein [Cohnella sp. AR92]RUS45268.1 hypothetical protein ELR57_20380 [Cohnella sp. AR92]
MNIAARRFNKHVLQRGMVIGGLLAASALLGWAVLNPGSVRLLITVTLVIMFAAIQIKSPRAAILSLMVFLPFVGHIRRVLIPVAGWNTLDALLVVSPIVVLLLSLNWLTRKYILREEIEGDTKLFKMVRIMLVIDLLQVFNPLQGSLFVGLSGIIYYIVPILMMILGREYLNEKAIRTLFSLVFLIGILAALYGYKQYWFGFFSFEEEWIQLSGYVALQVYTMVRPIGFFTNAAEYAHYLSIAITVGWGYFLRGSSGVRLFAAAGVVLMYTALFIESSRSAIVTCTTALFLMTVVCSKKASSKVILTLVAVGVLIALFFGMQRLGNDNGLITHSVSGLADPMGEDSTLPGHIDYMFKGFKEGFSNPLGYGLGVTTIASGKFGGKALSSEIDWSNQFIATGLFGGAIYLLVFFRTLFLGIAKANGGNMLPLIIMGMLVSEAGQWLTGGHYAVVAILWLAIGYLDRSTADSPITRQAINREGAYENADLTEFSSSRQPGFPLL